MVIVLAVGHKIRGFKPGSGQWIFKGDKICNTTVFEGEVKPSAPCRKILRHNKNPYGMKGIVISKIHGYLPSIFSVVEYPQPMYIYTDRTRFIHLENV
jgi:hypothetical protein